MEKKRRGKIKETIGLKKKLDPLHKELGCYKSLPLKEKIYSQNLPQEGNKWRYWAYIYSSKLLSLSFDSAKGISQIEKFYYKTLTPRDQQFVVATLQRSSHFSTQRFILSDIHITLPFILEYLLFASKNLYLVGCHQYILQANYPSLTYLIQNLPLTPRMRKYSHTTRSSWNRLTPTS